MRHRIGLVSTLGLALLVGLQFGTVVPAQARDPGAPKTEVREATDTYYDVIVKDPYRWLEDAGDPAVHLWSVAQDRRARKYLDGLAWRKPIYDRLYKQIAAASPSYRGLWPVADRIFAMYDQPPKQQPMIAVLGLAADPKSARVIVDPNRINPKGTTAIDWFVPSHDGRLVAVSMSDNGSEDGTLHVFDVAAGKALPDIIPRVQYPTGGGSLAWSADGKGFWYTRYPGPDRPQDEQHFFQKVYFHALGQDPASDPLVLGDGLPKVAEISLSNRYFPGMVLATVANGDGGEFAHYLIEPHGQPKQITRFEDHIVHATIAAGGTLYMVSIEGSPRGRLLKTTLDDPSPARARELVAQSEAVIVKSGEFNGDPVIATSKWLYVREIVGGPSRVAVFDLEGHPHGELPLPGPAEVSEISPLSDGTLLYDISTYLRPPYFARYDEASGRSADTKLAQTSPVQFKDTEVLREYATSLDGTKVPLNIIRKKGTRLDGRQPVLLYGYGGYGVVEAPYFLGPGTRLWLDAGGVFVDVNLRGGGEFGEEWHLAGNLTRKQNVFDDFIASAQYLIDSKYTTPARLAILGGSNGGLLMGASLTQRPELYRAVVSEVGIYDMLRVELDPNGLFNTTEFGSVKNPEQFRALYAYSPYHHVTDGTRYPAIFMQTGETDGRVNPAHSRKMIARLQAATSGGPVYLASDSNSGHGIGSALSIRVGQKSDVYAFLFDQLKMQFPKTTGGAVAR